MDKNILEEIKNNVYELEGLLELCRLREDKTDELLPLMRSRLMEINRLFSEPETPSEVREDRDMSHPEASIEDETPVASDDETPVAIDDETPVAIEDEISLAIEESQYNEESQDNQELAEATLFEEEEDSEGKSGFKERTVSEANPKPAFCINDRFRFRRELFNSSDAEFSDAMDLVATMDSYEEAEDYFFGNLGWDPESPEVIDFMAIIERYFSK